MGNQNSCPKVGRSFFGKKRATFLDSVRSGLNTKFDVTVDEGKERLNPSREKNKSMLRRRKVDEKSCVTFLLCDPPAGTSNELDVQNKWEENTYTTNNMGQVLCAFLPPPSPPPTIGAVDMCDTGSSIRGGEAGGRSNRG